jgi:hypothetical protein
MKKALICVAACGALLLGAESAGATTTRSFVTGSGRAPSPVPIEVGRTVLLELSARMLPDGSVQGHFTTHNFPATGEKPAIGVGDIDCLRVAGNMALASGTIKGGFVPGFGNPAGEKVTILIIDDGDHDIFTIEVSFLPFEHPIFPCQVPTFPPAFSQEGNFVVHE